MSPHASAENHSIPTRREKYGLGGIGLATLALAGFLVIIIVTITKGF